MNNSTIEVDQMRRIKFSGNVIPHSWYEILRFPLSEAQKDKGMTKGLVNLQAIIILAEICYYYRPREIEDETTGLIIRYEKKFKGDKLQRSYQNLGDKFGLTKIQTKDACKYLEDLGLITLEFRTVKIKDILCNNVLFIGINPKEICNITFKEKISEEASHHPTTPEVNSPYEPGGTYPTTSEVNTNTESILREKDLIQSNKIQNMDSENGTRRGTRLKEDWFIDDSLLEWLNKKHPYIGAEELEFLKDEFIIFWTNESGKKGIKLDWNSTFRGKINRYVVGSRRNTIYAPQKEKQETNAQRQARENREYRERLSSTPGVDPFKNDPVFS